MARAGVIVAGYFPEHAVCEYHCRRQPYDPIAKLNGKCKSSPRCHQIFSMTHRKLRASGRGDSGDEGEVGNGKLHGFGNGIERILCRKTVESGENSLAMIRIGNCEARGCSSARGRCQAIGSSKKSGCSAFEYLWCQDSRCLRLHLLT